MIELNEKDGAVTFKARVQPGAPRNEIAGELSGAIKLKVAAPPVDGKANQECARFLAKALRVPRGSVEIIAGESSRNKVIRVHNITAERVREVLK